jgi:penicillin G amidase
VRSVLNVHIASLVDTLLEMPGLSNRNPVAGYGNIGQVHIRYKPKPPPKRKFGVVFFFFCLSLFLFAYCWTDRGRRYNFALGPLRFAFITYDKLRYSIFDSTPPHSDQFSITLDSFGHPLIEGETLGDVIFGQGYVHAQEHLFQMDYLRKKAFGNLSQYEADARLPSDLFVRAFNLSGLAENDLLDQSTEELNLLERYADGVNLYLDEKHPLPLEYAVLGITSIERWHPRHTLCLLRLYALQLSDSWETELSRKLFAQSLKKDKTAWVESEHEPEELDTLAPDTSSYVTASASWGWVVSGNHTQSTKPMLLTRHSHETSSLSLYVQNTLKSRAKDLHVAGNSIPGVPFVLMGRTKGLAWTILPMPTGKSSQAVTVETLKMESDCVDACGWLSRLDDGSWVPAEVVTHEIQTRDAKKSTLSTISLRSIRTHSGVVLTPDLFPATISSLLHGKGPAGRDVAEYLTLRLPSLDPTKRVKMSVLVLLNQANNLNQFSAALRTSDLPFDWQFLCADRTGDIARFVTGNR